MKYSLENIDEPISKLYRAYEQNERSEKKMKKKKKHYNIIAEKENENDAPLARGYRNVDRNGTLEYYLS